MLQEDITAVLEADSRADLHDRIGHFTQRLGFDYFAAVLVVDHALGDSDFVALDNAPARYRESLEDPKTARADPVMQHCKQQSVPILWDQATYTRRGLGEAWEHQAGFGYRTGIGLALHLPEGRHFILGVDRDQDLPADAAELTRVVAQLQLFAMYAQDAASRLLLPPRSPSEKPKLTPREVEALQWTLIGKTAWETGELMKISERTAVMHLQNAMRKLDAASKHQAVIKALRAGLL